MTFATRGIPSGITVTGAFGIGSNVTVTPILTSNDPPPDTLATPTRTTCSRSCSCPARRRPTWATATVNFGPGPSAADADAACTGSAAAPSAPAGKVCLYLAGAAGADTVVDGQAIPGLAGSRLGFVVHAVSATTSVTGLFGTWAYTAP